MSVFLIADIKITDDSWVPDYAAKVHDIVEKHGGKYLSRSGNISNLEGDPLDAMLVAPIEFPSRRALESFVSDPAYAPFAEARKRGSIGRFRVIDDTDIAGTIPYLKKGD